jgi:hypothetical protein
LAAGSVAIGAGAWPAAGTPNVPTTKKAPVKAIDRHAD